MIEPAALVSDVAKVEVVCQCLQLATAALAAGKAIPGMIGQDQFEYGTTGLKSLWSVGSHAHAFGYRR